TELSALRTKLPYFIVECSQVPAQSFSSRFQQREGRRVANRMPNRLSDESADVHIRLHGLRAEQHPQILEASQSKSSDTRCSVIVRRHRFRPLAKPSHLGFTREVGLDSAQIPTYANKRLGSTRVSIV